MTASAGIGINNPGTSTNPQPPPDNASSSDSPSLSGIVGDVGLGLGIYGDLSRGGTYNDARAAVTAGKAATSLGAFGDSQSAGTFGVGSGLGALNNVAGIYTGIEKGGVLGDGGAVANAASLYGNISNISDAAGAGSFAYGDLAGAVGSYVAAPLALYNAIENYQSGDTGGDTIRGAEAGAAIGTAVVPGIGTIVGGALGAVVGAASSAFGPGKEDQENVTWDNYAKTFDSNPAAVNGATPSQNFQSLTGIFDSRGSSIPFYGKYGRMGEAKFTTDMMGQINQAFTSGKVTSADTPQSIYQKIVQPWITGMSSTGWQDANTSGGSATKGAVGNMLTNMIGQWMQGSLTAQTPVGVSGQTLPGLPAFAGGSVSPGAPSALSSLPGVTSPAAAPPAPAGPTGVRTDSSFARNPLGGLGWNHG